jgi:tetratricopeptide (TPR) repeat protein
VQLLAARPCDARALLLLGVIADKATSLALVEQAVYLDPTDAGAWYNLGVYEGERANLERALECYRRAVALEPTHLDALGNGCELLRRLEHFETALEWADRRLALAQESWSAHLNRGVCLFHLMRWREAEAAIDRARELGPDRPIVLWERFPLMLFQKRFAEAWAAFEHRFGLLRTGDLVGHAVRQAEGHDLRAFGAPHAILRNVQVSELNPGLQLYLTPAGTGCTSVKKELFH